MEPVRRLEDRLATIMVAVAALAVMWAIIDKRGGFVADGRTDLAVGDFLEVPGFDPAAGRTLVMWLSSSCSFCTASMPFYGDLQKDQHRTTRLVVIGHEDREQLRSYVREHNLEVDDVVSASGANVQLSMTPVLLLVGTSGKIESKWMGQISDSSVKDRIAQALR
jgi:hypothetical protein